MRQKIVREDAEILLYSTTTNSGGDTKSGSKRGRVTNGAIDLLSKRGNVTLIMFLSTFLFMVPSSVAPLRTCESTSVGAVYR